ncbi:MAG: energy transducer TonB [Bacteroidales bacterium]|nr:energy transducer TonB [Bacteroidales bacterium]
MIEKKSAKGNLENKKSTFVLIGLVAVLALVYASFELFASQDKKEIVVMEEEEVVIVEDNVIATDQTPPPPPPEPVQQQQTEIVLNIVDDNIKVETDWDFSAEFTEDEAIEEYVPIEIVEEEVEEAPPVRIAEKMPEFIGGTDALYEFLRNNLQYPEIARNNNIQGTVLIEFVVERDGRVSNVKAVAPLYPDCDAEAIRVVQKLPKWKPGEQMGKPVRVYYNLPIRFALN